MNSKPKSSIQKRQSSKPRNPSHKRMRFPDRWLQYAPIGRDIPGLRIVAFKTPLHSHYFTGMLGLVVDLTNTDKYYNAQDWLDNSVEYHKLKCRGHEVNQQEGIVRNFIATIIQFFAMNADNEKVVGVHCTHGLNRTGYLVCRYMIDYLGVSAAEAIERFEMNRGHSIERHHYITSLYESEARVKSIGIAALSTEMLPPTTTDDYGEAGQGETASAEPPAPTEPSTPSIEPLPENPAQAQPFSKDIVVAVKNPE